DSQRGRPVSLENPRGSKSKAVASGCYFCSRPVVANRFSLVKVKIDGQVKEVSGCKICKDELESSKKVKVLYFMKDGQPIHWSEVPDYKPSEDFWNINQQSAAGGPKAAAPTPAKRRLEIVKSAVDAREVKDDGDKNKQ